MQLTVNFPGHSHKGVPKYSQQTFGENPVLKLLVLETYQVLVMKGQRMCGWELREEYIEIVTNKDCLLF